jgi:hypothetical protein
MNAIVTLNSVPAYLLYTGQTSYKWGISAVYQLEDSTSFKYGSPFVVWSNFNTPLSEILDLVRNAVIADAQSQYSVTLTADNINILSLSAL